MLNELICTEGPIGVGKPYAACGHSDTRYRCCNCVGLCCYCPNCLVLQHKHTPLYCVEVSWSFNEVCPAQVGNIKKFESEAQCWMKASLKSLGLVTNLGQDGSICPAYLAKTGRVSHPTMLTVTRLGLLGLE